MKARSRSACASVVRPIGHRTVQMAREVMAGVFVRRPHHTHPLRCGGLSLSLSSLSAAARSPRRGEAAAEGWWARPRTPRRRPSSWWWPRARGGAAEAAPLAPTRSAHSSSPQVPTVWVMGTVWSNSARGVWIELNVPVNEHCCKGLEELAVTNHCFTKFWGTHMEGEKRLLCVLNHAKKKSYSWGLSYVFFVVVLIRTFSVVHSQFNSTFVGLSTNGRSCIGPMGNRSALWLCVLTHDTLPIYV